MFCPKCGKYIEEKGNFCPECGTKLLNENCKNIKKVHLNKFVTNSKKPEINIKEQKDQSVFKEIAADKNNSDNKFSEEKHEIKTGTDSQKLNNNTNIIKYELSEKEAERKPNITLKRKYSVSSMMKFPEKKEEIMQCDMKEKQKNQDMISIKNAEIYADDDDEIVPPEVKVLIKTAQEKLSDKIKENKKTREENRILKEKNKEIKKIEKEKAEQRKIEEQKIIAEKEFQKKQKEEEENKKKKMEDLKKSKIIICSSCGAENSKLESFCYNCGRPLYTAKEREKQANSKNSSKVKEKGRHFYKLIIFLTIFFIAAMIALYNIIF